MSWHSLALEVPESHAASPQKSQRQFWPVLGHGPTYYVRVVGPRVMTLPRRALGAVKSSTIGLSNSQALHVPVCASCRRLLHILAPARDRDRPSMLPQPAVLPIRTHTQKRASHTSACSHQLLSPSSLLSILLLLSLTSCIRFVHSRHSLFSHFRRRISYRSCYPLLF